MQKESEEQLSLVIGLIHNGLKYQSELNSSPDSLMQDKTSDHSHLCSEELAPVLYSF
ncbi:MAG: hypothetical protein ACFFD4_05530 [Candidatus Odinarchaeota archaeon]